MRPDLLALAGDLVKRGEPFALAIVVRREPPTSAQVGDMALVTEAGTFHGWLGGSCTQPTVVHEARRALADGMARLIALSPDPGADHRPGVTPIPATCASGGSVDIYIEPVLTPPRLLILGVSAAAQALARLGKAMGYRVDMADPLADPAGFPQVDRVLTNPEAPELRGAYPHPARLSIVVATMGQWDEQATSVAVALEPSYLGVVASRKRFDQICEALGARGVPLDMLARIKNPAGLDIGAETPEEIALSILAEIVRLRRAALKEGSAAEPELLLVAEELDPVCGMSVAVASAVHRAEIGGRTYYFCCGGCRERFLAAPGRYAAGPGMGAA
ncbi:MAG TPA: XdhC family protein [Candidatus Methylomirabilis sp.]|nr:XdhC family protein [Candidatus Methylomirabilis sp.]